MRIFLILYLIFNVSFSYSQSVVIEGRLDCADWLESRKRNNSATYEHYVIGLVNGLALGRMVDIWNAKGIKLNRTQLFYWMDNYCSKNPLNDVVTGSFDFADEVTNGGYKKALRK